MKKNIGEGRLGFSNTGELLYKIVVLKFTEFEWVWGGFWGEG